MLCLGRDCCGRGPRKVPRTASLILDSQEPDQNSGKERRVLFSHKLPFVVSVCLPFLEIWRCCGSGRKPEVARPAWLLLITAQCLKKWKEQKWTFLTLWKPLKNMHSWCRHGSVAQRWKAKKRQRSQNGGLLFNWGDGRGQALSIQEAKESFKTACHILQWPKKPRNWLGLQLQK